MEQCQQRNVRGMAAIENQHLEATVIITDAGKNHL